MIFKIFRLSIVTFPASNRSNGEITKEKEVLVPQDYTDCMYVPVIVTLTTAKLPNLPSDSEYY